jgi:hypothetical protein
MLVRVLPVEGREAVDPIDAPAFVFDLDDVHRPLAGPLAGQHDRETLDGGHGLTHLCTVVRRISITPAGGEQPGAIKRNSPDVGIQSFK